MFINCFIPYVSQEILPVIASFKNSPLINKIYLLHNQNIEYPPENCELILTNFLASSDTIKKIAGYSDTEYSIIFHKSARIEFGMFALERIFQIAEDSGAGIVYSDYCRSENHSIVSNPLIAYQKGSLRDDFDFGFFSIYKSMYLRRAASLIDENYMYAGLYDLRLKMSEQSGIVHINEYLYTVSEKKENQVEGKLFDYVDPKNREKQIEMEKACTSHLKRIGAYLEPGYFREVNITEEKFEFEASVIIPVRNRVRTIADAIQSVFNQKANFKFNLIVVDNYSTDGTTEEIEKFSGDNRLIHLIPENNNLGIGGCWNAGVHHPKCGRFAVQLDSDDVYSNENTLQRIVDTFYHENCAMVVGTYMLTDFDLNMIPPGIIDHQEWTEQNGRNNALRINGLGAPRAFYTPLLRKVKVPNTSYGEDYALGLHFSRYYRIGRIYDVVYLCRRWEDNSDAEADILKKNLHNIYKDRLRTWEIEARIALNKQKA